MSSVAEFCFMVLSNGDFSETMRSTNKLLVPVDSVLLPVYFKHRLTMNLREPKILGLVYCHSACCELNVIGKA